jgi:hypothetical protein
VSSTDAPSPPAGIPGPAGEAAAALVTALGCVLLGAPVGLLWAAVTPRVEAVLADGGVQVVSTTSQEFIAADGWFLGLVAVAGLVAGGLVAVFGRRYGLGSAVGLAAGGLLGAEVARRTGQLVGSEQLRDLLVAGDDGAAAVPLRLRSVQALAAWPVVALVVHMLTAIWSHPPGPRPGTRAVS